MFGINNELSVKVINLLELFMYTILMNYHIIVTISSNYFSVNDEILSVEKDEHILIAFWFIFVRFYLPVNEAWNINSLKVLSVFSADRLRWRKYGSPEMNNETHNTVPSSSASSVSNQVCFILIFRNFNFVLIYMNFLQFWMTIAI